MDVDCGLTGLVSLIDGDAVSVSQYQLVFSVVVHGFGDAGYVIGSIFFSAAFNAARAALIDCCVVVVLKMGFGIPHGPPPRSTHSRTMKSDRQIASSGAHVALSTDVRNATMHATLNNRRYMLSDVECKATMFKRRLHKERVIGTVFVVFVAKNLFPMIANRTHKTKHKTCFSPSSFSRLLVLVRPQTLEAVVDEGHRAGIVVVDGIV